MTKKRKADGGVRTLTEVSVKLADILTEKREEIISLWVEAVLSTYPETAFLRTNRDPFTNPVGNMIKEAAQGLFSAVVGETVDTDAVKKALDRFIKIRAVQTFTPSQSVGVIFLLKPILRKTIAQLVPQSSLGDYLDLESRVDTLALLAFDLYMKDREKLADIRIKEIRDQYAQLKRWAQNLNDQAPLGTFIGCGNKGCG